MLRVALASAVLASMTSMPAGERSAKADTRVSPTTLAHLRDAARPVLVLAPTVADGRTREQLRILDANAGAASERQMVTVVISADGSAPRASDLSLTPADARAARERFGVAASDFAVILVGKDGGEKLVEHAPVPFERFRALIDAMPMRRAEIRARDAVLPGSKAR